ncbi:AcrR family transcriptional regulator [Thermocatellispora tengchongensis]|uniref:AcrR family transcriptional regulator n=1 Tax=Thermocatellispora tengchongensis TaxID=1073253 RepID=A0A840P2V1_9ACTN|nr:TetR/AcrR family transcriptional regulator C-terminal domain-containing protein [Thermocatellispora tengchongensis]MBB5133309.1 AcrR family transcriptional regulator [Thermocatellispora tengchongensis]
MVGKQQYATVWAREAAEGARRAAQTAPAGLNRTQIVRAALEILDAEGLDSLSMRRLGTKLGVGATSLYWYVANKGELIDLAMDEVYGEVALPPAAGIGWREAAKVFAHSLHRTLLRHPWATRILGARPAMGPNAMDLSERAMALFEDAGFTGTDIDYALSTVMSFTLGLSVSEASWAETLKSSRMSDDEWMAQHTEALRTALAGRPRLAAIHAKLLAEDGPPARQARFDYGLDAILDGLAARLDARRQEPAHAEDVR